MSNLEIKSISSKHTHHLRQRVLRPGQPIENVYYPNDETSSTLHLGVFDKKILISIATFFPESHKDFRSKSPYRLRGMATEHSHQRKGVGRTLLLYGISELKSKGCDFLWCNARESAFGFYQNLGFKIHGPLFEISGAGPHKVLFQILN